MNERSATGNRVDGSASQSWRSTPLTPLYVRVSYTAIHILFPSLPRLVKRNYIVNKTVSKHFPYKLASATNMFYICNKYAAT